MDVRMIYRVLPYMHIISYGNEGSQYELIRYVHTWCARFVEADISIISEKFSRKRAKMGENVLARVERRVEIRVWGKTRLLMFPLRFSLFTCLFSYSSRVQSHLSVTKRRIFGVEEVQMCTNVRLN